MSNAPAKLSFLGLLLLGAASCGGSDAVTNPLNSANLSADEAAAVAAQLSSAASAVSSSAQAADGSSPVALQAPRSSATTVTQTPNGSIACPVSGHITYSGNITASASTTSWSVYGGVTFQYGDRTNNLNDCAVTKDVVLDGTLNFTIAGDNTSGIGWTLNGSIDIDKPSSGGGLTPRGSCFVSLNMPRGGTRATGSVCGQSIN